MLRRQLQEAQLLPYGEVNGSAVFESRCALVLSRYGGRLPVGPRIATGQSGEKIRQSYLSHKQIKGGSTPPSATILLI